MKLEIEPGKYVVTVSGGVDSVALLDMLTKLPDVQLIVAHYDHGIRPDSNKDRVLVQKLAARHGLPFVYAEGKLGPGTSEAAGRQARYDFFHKVRQEYDAKAIITAHHQDDMLETAILNLIRGTGRKGLSSLISRADIIRPMLHLSKSQILAYAKKRGLTWHEDSTNADERYLRNYIRHHLLPQFDDEARRKLLNIIEQSRELNQELDMRLLKLLQVQPSVKQVNRQWFISLPHSVAKEFLATWLRTNNVTGFDSKALERIATAAKTKRPGAIIDIVGGVSLAIEKKYLALTGLER